ncbi:MAG: methylmalonyl-CoA epimerase [Phycisphaeraceae bacterium]|nr:methylmalonyl-CoA epimerase [Phycisphaeraceae bacterium]
MIQAKAINHIGIAVKSIQASRDFYEKVLGAQWEGEEVVVEQKVKVGFLKLGPAGAEVRLELLEPTSPESTIAGFIEKRGEGLHHVAVTVDNIQKRLDDLKAGGVRLIDEKPRQGAHQAQIAFLHPKSSCGILTELCEPRH